MLQKTLAILKHRFQIPVLNWSSPYHIKSELNLLKWIVSYWCKYSIKKIKTVPITVLPRCLRQHSTVLLFLSHLIRSSKVERNQTDSWSSQTDGISINKPHKSIAILIRLSCFLHFNSWTTSFRSKKNSCYSPNYILFSPPSKTFLGRERRGEGDQVW